MFGLVWAFNHRCRTQSILIVHTAVERTLLSIPPMSPASRRKSGLAKNSPMADAATQPCVRDPEADASLLKFKAGKMTHTRVPGENKAKVVAHAKKGFIFC